MLMLMQDAMIVLYIIFIT